MRRITSVVIAAVALLAAGCGSGKVDVTGRVNYQGRPVVFGAVFLAGTDGVPRECILREDGTYLIKQVPPGEAVVAVVSPNPAALAQVEGWFPIPDVYGRLSTSPARIEVRSDTPTHDIRLE